MKNVLMATVLLFVFFDLFAGYEVALLQVKTAAVAKNGYSNKDSLVAITRQQFQAGRQEQQLRIDTTIKKRKRTIRIGACKVFKDDLSDEGYSEYDYAGDLDSALVFKAVKQTLYNGEVYVVVNRDSCKRYYLSGRPHVFGNGVINFNESETTDRQNYIQIWAIINGVLRKQKTLEVDDRIWLAEVRIGAGGYILLRDFDNKYWKLSKAKLPGSKR